MEVGQSACLLAALQAMLLAGQPVERILPAFTANVADLLRLRSKGRIRVGLDADLVVLDENFKLRDVMVLGEWHVKGGAQVRFGQFESPA
jgi:beta-aspartyl-dipeptidase (metallo-type)